MNQVCRDPKIRITLEHVQKALKKCRANQISAHELVNWATMLVTNNVFYWDAADNAIAEYVNRLCLDLVASDKIRFVL